ncbi:unnamed protein product [Auanema sp. JU1783]|nr:unnamed protein product [Auanema sp. JU1783]
MSGTGFSEAAMRAKLAKLTSQQESIQTLSLWLLHHQRKSADAITHVWLKEIKMETNASRLVNLIYLANDVIQNSRKKAPEFMGKFFHVLEPAFKYCSRIQATELERAVQKVLKVFTDRQIYSLEQLSKLENAAHGKKHSHVQSTSQNTVTVDPPTLYDPEVVTKTVEELIESLHLMKNPASLDENIRGKLACYPEAVGTPSMLESIKNADEMKDLMRHVDEAEPLARDYCKRLADEMMERRNLQKLLDAMLVQVRATVDHQETVLREVKRKEDQVKSDLTEIHKTLESLPDLSDIPVDTPLPSLEKLFESNLN